MGAICVFGVMIGFGSKEGGEEGFKTGTHAAIAPAIVAKVAIIVAQTVGDHRGQCLPTKR